MMVQKQILENCLEFSEFTDPGRFLRDLQSLPRDPREFGLLIRKSIIHRETFKSGNTGSNSDLRYGDISRIPRFRQPEDDIFPTVSAILSELYRRDPRGLVADRAPENKLILTCRFVSILTASVLKAKGIPARVRSGFAPYFQVEGFGSRSVDHWIAEYWDSERKKWILIDVDGSIEPYLDFDPYEMPREKFDFPADAWAKVRSGKADGTHFWNAGGHDGPMAISWSLFYDFHCLMNFEPIYLHTPKMTKRAEFPKLSEKDLGEIDSLAELMREPDKNFDQLQVIFATNEKFRTLKGGLL